ncbi:MAG: sortase [Candidatus Saccharimonadales bacterium]
MTRRRLVIALCLLPAGIGVYIALLVFPTTVYSPPPAVALENPAPLVVTNDDTAPNRLLIPKIGVAIPYLTGGPKVLNENAWHRYPEHGNPAKGGNFIVSAHRFKLGLTPGATQRKSPFYHINKLTPGDKIFVDFKGNRYEYEVVRRFTVKPHQTEIEAPSETPKLTLYTCTFKGEHDGREVVEARPLFETAHAILRP